MAIGLFTSEHAEKMRALGEYAGRCRDLPLDECLEQVHRVAAQLRVTVTESIQGHLLRWHDERQRESVQYVRGPLRERHKQVVPMVVKAKPQFKRAKGI